MTESKGSRGGPTTELTDLRPRGRDRVEKYSMDKGRLKGKRKERGKEPGEILRSQMKKGVGKDREKRGGNFNWLGRR